MLVYGVKARSPGWIPACLHSINPASMKSRGANVETRANLSVNTISSYAEALATAPPPAATFSTKHVCRSVHAEQSDCIIWAYSSICVAASCRNPFQAVSHPPFPSSLPNTPSDSGEVWKMEVGNHAKWTYSPACRKITRGRTISHLLLHQPSCRSSICTNRRSQKMKKKLN